MARTAKGLFRLVIDLTETITGLGIGNRDGSVSHFLEYLREMTTGTADGAIDRIWSTRSGTVTAASPVSVDLSGAVADVLDSGVTVVFAELQGIIIKNTATAGNLLIGTSAANVGFLAGGTSASNVIPPGGWMAFDFGTSGLAVTNSSSDVLKIDASAGTVTYEAAVFGRSA